MTPNLNAVPIKLWQVLWPNSVNKIAAQRVKGQWLQNSSDLLGVEPSLLTEIDDYYGTLGGNEFQIYVSINGAEARFNVKRGVVMQAPFTLRLAAH